MLTDKLFFLSQFYINTSPTTLINTMNFMIYNIKKQVISLFYFYIMEISSNTKYRYYLLFLIGFEILKENNENSSKNSDCFRNFSNIKSFFCLARYLTQFTCLHLNQKVLYLICN